VVAAAPIRARVLSAGASEAALRGASRSALAPTV
jgi:hypothetical protein